MSTAASKTEGRSFARAPAALAVFARAAVAGKAKTRLHSLLGPRGAADFHAALVSDALRKAAALGKRVTLHFFLAGRRFPPASSLRNYTRHRQRGRDLGERLERAFGELLRRHPSVVVMGTDSPLVPRRVLHQAFAELRASEAVLGPCPDGGFFLIGLRRLAPGQFRGVRWGSGWACRDVLARLARQGLSCSLVECYADVDLPRDVERLKARMLACRAARRLAPNTWRFLKDFFAFEARPQSAASRKSGSRKAKPLKARRARSSRRR